MIRKVTAVILVLTLILLNAYSINAAGIIGEMETSVSGMNRLTVSAALNNYFNSRKAFLLGQTDTINVPLQGVIDDEEVHKQRYESQSIVFVNSEIYICDIVSSDTQADAKVTETVTYLDSGVSSTATVTHDLFLALNDYNVPVVIHDGYYEMFSGFRSCAYVDEDSVATMNTVGGSGNCLVYTAEGELGEGEDADKSTKYGEWYAEYSGYDYFITANWCVMFVSWCAKEANISNDVIDYIGGEDLMLDFFDLQGRYYSRSVAVNSLAPTTGDIVFFTWGGQEADHVGIVRYVDASYIYVVHGNSSQNDVGFTTYNRNNSQIFGYAKPAYASTGHTYGSDYQKDGTQHWLECENCGCEYEMGLHSLPDYYVDNATHHWKVCSTCGQETVRESHTFEDVHAGWVFMCTECGYIEENWGAREGAQ